MTYYKAVKGTKTVTVEVSAAYGGASADSPWLVMVNGKLAARYPTRGLACQDARLELSL